MLGKLLKYDLKWMYKNLLIFYILALFFAVITKLLNQIENSLIFFVIGKICAGVVISMTINILINNFMRVWARFIRNLYKDESYLTHTLPAERRTIYTSKILSAIITMITSVIVIIICLAICYLTKDNIELLKKAIESTAVYFNSSVSSFLITIIITLFFELLFAMFAGILGIILGHKSNNMKILKSIIFGFIAYMIPSILTLVGIFIIGLFNPEVMDLFNKITGFSTEAIKTVLFGGIAMYFAYNIIYYFLGKKIIEKGVNID